jgi:tetratricopeptide (TPR) repeat protein
MGEDDRFFGRVLALAEPGSPADPKAESLGTDALLARLAQAQSALAQERAEAPALLELLLAEPNLRRQNLAETDSRFHSWGICELLLDRALAEEAAPDSSGSLAALALAIAGHLDPRRHAAPVVEDLKARGWACLGRALLSQGDLEAAGKALQAAASRLAEGTGDLLVEARLLEFEAAVREREGRLGEAAALLKQAASRYREVGDTHLLARAQEKRDQLLQQASGRAPARPAPGQTP